MTRIIRLVAITISLSALLLYSKPVAAEQRIDPDQAQKDEKDATLWYDIRLLGVEGQGWTDTKAPYDRFPARAEKTIPPSVWSLSRHSAGICVRFESDATTIKARWKLTSPRLAMPHMAATGVSGVDLYVKTDKGAWRWLACGRPTAQKNVATLVRAIPQKSRQYMLYLPLYNGVSQVELGLQSGQYLAKLPRDKTHSKPIVFWGTSITHGACASRPGMVHTAILGRRLDRPVINLGFSGNGRMQPEVTPLLAELDAAVFVIDCLPNMVHQDVAKRIEPTVKTIRKAHPHTPILLVEDRTYADAFLLESKRVRSEKSRAALHVGYQRLVAAGDKNLHYLEGEDLLGDDGEATVDSSHPTDLGFLRMADKFEAVLRPLLKQ